MAGTVVAAVIVFVLMFLWTVTNVVVSASLWYSRALVQSDRKILVYLVIYWLAMMAGLMIVGIAINETGMLREWINDAGTNLWYQGPPRA
jgi:hypothetical protein